MHKKAICEQVYRMPSSARSILPPASLITCTSALERAGSYTMTLTVCACVEACPGAVGPVRLDSLPLSWQGSSKKPSTLFASQMRSCVNYALFPVLLMEMSTHKANSVRESRLITQPRHAAPTCSADTSPTLPFLRLHARKLTSACTRRRKRNLTKT